MKIYKYNKVYRNHIQDIIYGIIVDKKVDNFNEPMKVFVPIGRKDLDISSSTWWSNSDFELFETPDERHWKHLSGLKLEETTAKDRKGIKEAATLQLKELTSKCEHLNKLLEELK